MASVEKKFNISRHGLESDPNVGGSKLTSLTNPANIGKIKYLQVDTTTPKSASDLAASKAVTGVVFGFGHGTAA